MYGKLYPNIRRMTRGFMAGFICITLSVLMLRLTVFSDMAVLPEQSGSVLMDEKNSFQMLSRLYFPDAASKGDLFIVNNSEEQLIKVNIALKDTGDSILSTGFIDPGSSKNSDKLNPFGQKLDEGVYTCVAEVSQYHPDDVRNAIATSRAEIEVYIGQKPEKAK